MPSSPASGNGVYALALGAMAQGRWAGELASGSLACPVALRVGAVMNRVCAVGLLTAFGCSSRPHGPTDVQRPFVVNTIPKSGSSDVDPSLATLTVEFSEAMMPGSWSWVQESALTYPETSGDPVYTSATTIELPVRLDANKTYTVLINSEPRFLNFRDSSGNPAVPFVLTFTTGAN